MLWNTYCFCPGPPIHKSREDFMESTVLTWRLTDQYFASVKSAVSTRTTKKEYLSRRVPCRFIIEGRLINSFIFLLRWIFSNLELLEVIYEQETRATLASYRSFYRGTITASIIGCFEAAVLSIYKPFGFFIYEYTYHIYLGIRGKVDENRSRNCVENWILVYTTDTKRVRLCVRHRHCVQL